MFRVCLVSLAALLVIASAAPLSAQETLLRATLSNEAETHDVVPTLEDDVTPRPVSFGNATFTLSEDMTSLSFTADIFNIDVTGTQTPDEHDNLAAAHIHVRPPDMPNGGVVWGFFGAPFNDNNPDDSVVTPFATGVGGTFSGKWDAAEGNNTTLTAQLPNILDPVNPGRAYINFHTNQFGGGEIRGNIFVVPEPASIVMAVTGGLLAMLLMRRKRVR